MRSENMLPVVEPLNTRIAVIQFAPKLGAREENLAAIDRLVRSAAAQGADVVVTPELADSGYMFADREELRAVAGLIPGGVSALRLEDLAEELNLHLVCGLAELDRDKIFNTAVLIGPRGLIGKYRKLHLWDRENDLFSKGDLGIEVFETPFGRLGMAICYDSWFPEMFRTLTIANADLVCVPTNWVPMPGSADRVETMANILIQAAAHTNGLFVAAANRVGVERGQSFIGRSIIVDCNGWPISGPASADAEEVLWADIQIGTGLRRQKLNERNDLILDRRSDVYG